MFKLIAVFIVITPMCFAYDLDLQSSQNQTQLIELFTSEGCSSCPPAERWISGLKKDQRIWKEVIPISFHVDYWDYLGWKDKFSSPAFSMRQQIYRLKGNLNGVYTPGLLLNGQEWRAWRLRIIPENNHNVGVLKLALKGRHITAKYQGVYDNEDLQLNIALIGMNIIIPIKAGENKGKSLKHDFVVLKHEVYDGNKSTWMVTLDKDFFKTTQKDLAFVAWIQNTNNPAPIQAIGGTLN